MRILYEQFSNIQKMGPMSTVMSMIPGFGNDMMPKGQEKQSQAKIKRMMCLMDSMTDEELARADLKKLQDPKRMARCRQGGGAATGGRGGASGGVQAPIEDDGKDEGAEGSQEGGVWAGSRRSIRICSRWRGGDPAAELKPIGGMGGPQNMLKQLEGQDLGQMQQMMGKMMKGGKMPPGMGF